MKPLWIAAIAALPALAGSLSACSKCSAPGPERAFEESCRALSGQTIAPDHLGLPSGAATVDSAALMAPGALSVVEHGPTPAATITPATPRYCKVLGTIAPLDPGAPPIHFEVNLPAQWNGRSVQYGGGGFNGALVTGLALPPAARYDQPAPLAQGFVTYGTDSGHQTRAGQPQQAFALDDEALRNFAHASYKKVRDVAVELMKRAYGRGPDKLYYLGSSEGGREGLAMAQRYPNDYDGIFSRVPVVGFTALQHAGARAARATRGESWLGPAKVKLVHEAVLAACDASDGLTDGIVSDPVGCLAHLDLTRLRCDGGASGDGCLSEAQLRAVQTLHAPYVFPFALADGVTEYPGWGVSGEGTPGTGAAGGWGTWWLGQSPPTSPPSAGNGVGWVFAAGTLEYLIARDPKLDLARYRPEDFAARVREVSALLDATSPDLSAFRAHGGKLILLEHLSDYAQSPYAGVRYHASVVARLGQEASSTFVRLFAAPGVDHVGAGAPANVDMLGALVAWVERGTAPAGLALVEQGAKPPFAVTRSRPLCEWPLWPRYKAGDPASAESFECAR